MDSKSKRELEECVLRILKHGDPNKLTESKVRKLAEDETGFDLTDLANRKIVKRVVENFFVSRQDDGSHDGKKSQATSVSRKPHTKQPSAKAERRRRLVGLDDEDEEEGEPEARPGSNETRESEEETEKPAKKGKAVASSNPGRSQSRRNVSESEEFDRPDASDASVDDDEQSPGGRRVAKKRRADVSDEAGSDEEEERRTTSSKRKNAPSVNNKQRRAGEDEEDEEDEEQIMGHSKKRPDRKLFPAGDIPVCELSKNRFVAVQDFNGKALISIREYYEKDGKLLPGRKGISLTVEQWEAVKEGIPDVDAAIRQMQR